jgi:hypothetical protein
MSPSPETDDLLFTRGDVSAVILVANGADGTSSSQPPQPTPCYLMKDC